jgi:hypothetical protein
MILRHARAAFGSLTVAGAATMRGLDRVFATPP